VSLKVVNSKKGSYDIYIGKGSYFASPYSEKDGNREEIIALYKRYFYDRIEKDKKFKETIEWLRGKDIKLGCHCKPLPCHGDIIVEYLEKSH
jgi:hypothetical protein